MTFSRRVCANNALRTEGIDLSRARAVVSLISRSGLDSSISMGPAARMNIWC